jgi:GDPmannose 4,6-dehydratase
MQWLMLQQSEPEDFVIATGEQHSVREFVEIAADTLGMNIAWQGTGVDEKGIDTGTQKTIVAVDTRYFRPTEVETLLGNPAKAREKIGWAPEISFRDLVAEMVQQDLDEAKRDNLCKKHGFSTFDYNE